MTETTNPFYLHPGCEGVVVRFADKRWYLREWHSHAALEINLVVRGSGGVLLEDRRYPLLPGNLIWLWPGQRHVPAEWSSDMLMWIIEWQPGLLPRLRRARGQDVPPPNDPSVYYCRRVAETSLAGLQGLLASVAAQTRPDCFNAGLYFALLTLWDEFQRARPVAHENFLHPKLEKIIGWLNDPDNTMSLAELARGVRLSPCYLSALFQEQTGLSVPDYRNRRRIQTFFTLFREQPSLCLLELALAAGFGSYAQFYRVFHAATGQTPRQWVRAARE